MHESLAARRAEVEVEQENVETAADQRADRAFGRRHTLRIVAALLEGLADERAENVIVLDHENAHRLPPSGVVCKGNRVSVRWLALHGREKALPPPR
jgi:hypothetical protein